LRVTSEVALKYLLAVIAILVGQAAMVWAVFWGTNLRIENWWAFVGGLVVANVCAFVVKACDD